MTLAHLTHADFEPLCNETFTLLGVEGLQTEVVLTKVVVVGKPFQADYRAPFSLLFHFPASVGIQQGTYCLSHPVLGELEIFLVPVGADLTHVFYEAIFN